MSNRQNAFGDLKEPNSPTCYANRDDTSKSWPASPIVFNAVVRSRFAFKLDSQTVFPGLAIRTPLPPAFANARNNRELDPKVCVRNLHTAHFSLSIRRDERSDHPHPRGSLICTITDRKRL